MTAIMSFHSDSRDAGCVPDDVQDFLRSRVDKTLYNICSV